MKRDEVVDDREKERGLVERRWIRTFLEDVWVLLEEPIPPTAVTSQFEDSLTQGTTPTTSQPTWKPLKVNVCRETIEFLLSGSPPK